MSLENILAQLRSERARIDQAISALEGLVGPTGPRRGRPLKATSTAIYQRRHMNAAARKRISAAMKKRWAAWKGESAPKEAKSRRAMSAAARKELSVLIKARWAAKHKAKAA